MTKTSDPLRSGSRPAGRWLRRQPIFALFIDRKLLRDLDREQRLALVFTPILVLALVIGGSIGAFLSNSGPDQSDIALDQASEVVANDATDLEHQEELEPEIFHSISRYTANVVELRQEIDKLQPYLDGQRSRLVEALTWADVHEWAYLGEMEGDLCFQNKEVVECIDAEVFDTLRTEAQTFAAANPEGIGLCYNWFDEVCMSGDWFPSRAAFIEFLEGTKEYIMDGDESSEEMQTVLNQQYALDTSPRYEPTRRAILDDDTFSEDEWRAAAKILRPDKTAEELVISPYGDGGGFCIGTADAGDCFESRADYERGLAEIDAYQRQWREDHPGWEDFPDGCGGTLGNPAPCEPAPPDPCEGQEGHGFYGDGGAFLGCFTSWEEYDQSNPAPAPESGG